jgi:gliding motility-associated-like protein
LVIDPELAFSSYIGSVSSNFGFTASYDNEGNLFGGAIVFGAQYPTTVGAYQFTWGAGDIDCGISKFNEDGTDPLYSTYLGGSGNEAPHSIIVNDQNELYILGSTSSSDFPLGANAFQDEFGGGFAQGGAGYSYTQGADIFVSKLSADGSELLGGTFVGGSSNDGIGSGSILDHNYGDRFRGEIVVDNDGFAYVASVTGSADFPIENGYSDNFSGTLSGVVFKLTPDLSDMVWSTFTGGESTESAISLQLADDNSVYFTGGTTSSTLPVSTDAYQGSFSGGVDGYIGHISADGSQLLACTYNGTSQYDQNYFVQIDTEGDIYVVGQTLGNYPVSEDVYANNNSGQFIHKFSPDLTTSIWSTRVGSGNGVINISPSAFLVTNCGEIFLSGWGGNLNNNNNGGGTAGLPVSGDAFQGSTDGNDFYLMVLSPNAESLEYATYFGGFESSEHVDGGTSRFDKSGTVYQAVCAGCGSNNDFPTQPGVWSQTNPSSNCNLGVFKFKLSSVTASADIDAPGIVCPGTEFGLINQSEGADTFTWTINGETSNETELTYSFDEAGTYEIQLLAEDSQGCLASDSTTVTVVVEEGPDVNTNEPEPVCPGDAVQLEATGAESWEWFPDDDLNDNDIPNPIFTGNNTTELTVVGSNSCGNDTSTVLIVVGTLDIDISDDTSICPGDSIELFASGGSTYAWSPPFGLSSTNIANPLASPPTTTTYQVEIETAEGCTVTENVEITVLPPAPELTGDDTKASCNGVPVTLFVEGADNYEWSPSEGLSSTTIATPDANPTQNTTYTVVGSNACGEDSFQVTVLVSSIDITIDADSVVCANEPFFLRASGANNYVWQPTHLVFNKYSAETQASIDQTSLLTVTGIDSLGCSGSESVMIRIYPRVPFRLGNDRVIDFGEEIILETFSSYPINWEENPYISCTTCNNPTVFPQETTTYIGEITTDYGCPERDSVTVFVRGELYVPNAFTPDGDGLNDIFKAEGLDIVKFNMKVFNRWGELIFESDDINHGWNGSSGNNSYYSPPGIYQYIIVAQEHKGQVFEYRGHVHLLR